MKLATSMVGLAPAKDTLRKLFRRTVLLLHGYDIQTAPLSFLHGIQ